MKSNPLFRACVPGLLGIALVVSTSSGQVVLSPVAVFNTNVTTYDNTVSVTNMINQSGITTPFVSGVTGFDTYFANPGQKFATSGNGGTNNWQSEVAFDLGSQGYLDFDLGAVYRINQLAIWNRSLSNVTVKILNDLTGPEQTAGSFTLINRQSFTFSYAADLLPLNATYEGRYVRLVIDSVYPIQGFTFGYAIVGEVVASVLPRDTPLPTVQMTRDPNGDVTVTFTGTLQTAPTINGTFTNLPGNPPSPHTISRTDFLPEQYFRARGN